MPKFKIPVSWSVGGFITVEAPTLEQAVEDFDPDDHTMMEATDDEYVEGSLEQSCQDVEHIRRLQDEDEEEEIVVCDTACCTRPYAKTFNAHTSPWCPKWVTGDYCEECFQKVEQEYREERELNEASANPPPNV